MIILNKIARVLVMLILISNTTILAQDPNFSMFYNNPTYYNPGMVAINNGFTLRFNLRNQWTPIPSKLNTFSGSFEGEAINKVGVGVQAFSDVAGEGLLRTTGAYFQYMYRPVENKNFLVQIGSSVGVVNKFIDMSRLVFSDQLDEIYGKIHPSGVNSIQRPSVTFADFSFGGAVKFNGNTKKNSGHFKKINVTTGVGLHHLTNPQDPFLGGKSRLPMKLVFHGNMNLLVDKIVFSPSLIYEHQNKFETLTFGMNIINRPFFAGFWLRNKNYLLNFKKFDSFIITLGVHLNAKHATSYRIAYSYDFTVSDLSAVSTGSNEISLIIDMGNRLLFNKIRSNRKAHDKYKCPEDFKGF